MRRVFVSFVMLVIVGLATAEPEGLCDSGGWPALGIVEVGTYPDVYYVDDRNFVLGNGIWLYEETNGVYDDENGHLQRGSYDCWNPDDCEICWDRGEWDPDRMML